MHRKDNLEARLLACADVMTAADLTEKNMKVAAQMKDYIDFATVFGNSAPVHLEIGCGKGHYLSSYAAKFPGEVCVGIDLISKRIEDGRRRAKNKGAENAFFVKAEAMEFLEAMPLDVRLDKIFIFFPDPWPKEKHHKRRLIRGEFLDYIRQFCRVGCKMYFRTDYEEYFEWAKNEINQNTLWELTDETELPHEEVSQFQRILPVFSTLVAVAS